MITLQLKWPTEWLGENIAIKELVPTVAGVALWGVFWQGVAIACHCDNMAVVSAINSGCQITTCKPPSPMPVFLHSQL